MQAAGTSTRPFRGINVVAPSTGTANLKAAQVSGVCTKLGDTVVNPSTGETFTCSVFTNLGSYKGASIQWRWSLLYTDKNLVHKLVLDSLNAYDRTFGSKADQQKYETQITSNLELGAFVNLLVTMSKQTRLLPALYQQFMQSFDDTQHAIQQWLDLEKNPENEENTNA